MNNIECKIKRDIISEKEAVELTKLMTDGKEKYVQFKIGPYSEEHIGHLGSHRRLVLETKSDKGIKSYSFFVKSIPYENLEEANYVIEKGVFQQETTFFSEIVPLLTEGFDIGKWGPVCFMAKSDTVVLEDLGAQGYSMRGKILDKELTKSALTSVARLHAASILAEAKFKKPFNELYPDAFKEMTFMGFGKNHGWCMSGVNAAVVVAKSLGLDSSKITMLYEELLRTIKAQKSKVTEAKSSVICHGDLWSNNILWFSDNQHCVLVDFQFIRYASLAQDITLLLHLSTTREFRKKYEDEMIRFYHTELSEIVKKNNPNVKVLSLEELMVEVEEQKLRAVVTGIIYSSSVTLSKKLAPEIFTDPEEYDKFTYGDRSAKVLELMQRDETFRSRVEDSVIDIVEFGQKWKKT